MASPFTAFPTFGGPEQGGGITNIKLNPAQVRFPTARRPVSAKAPAEVNPFAAIAPLILQGIGSQLFKGDAKPAPAPTDTDINQAYSLEQIQRELGKGDEAQYAADQIYGPSRELSGLQKYGRMALENLPALFFKDPRELSSFQSTSNLLNKARTTSDIQRKKFIGDYTSAQVGKTLNVTPAFDVNNESVTRNAIEGPNGGFYVQSLGREEDKTIDGTSITEGSYYRNPKWIIGEPVKSDSTLRASKTGVENDFRTKRDEIEAVATNLAAANPLINNVIKTVLSGDEITTWWQPLLTLKNQGEAFINSYNKDKDPAARLENGVNNSWYDQTTGKPTEKILSGDALPYMEEVWDAETNSFKQVQKMFDFETTFGEAGNNAEFRSTVTTLAYLAAAANGQTGKNLSDKDLALHLEQLGATFGGSSGAKTPDAVIRSITTWYDNIITSTSKKMQELERNSLASDWRRTNPDKTTPWSERYLSGIFDPGKDGKDSRVQKLFKLPTVWKREQNQDWSNYLNLLAAARSKYGTSAVKQNPVSGMDWENEIYNPYEGMLNNQKGTVTSDPSGKPKIVVPPRRVPIG
tara:strand:- start:1482 stop:3218 length:1737 start_codon:yes stop_codon:yes gene_type:complete